MTATATKPSLPPLAVPKNARQYVVQFGRLLRYRMREDGSFQQAAALSYNTLFSLLPTLVLAILVISLVSSQTPLAVPATEPAAAAGTEAAAEPPHHRHLHAENMALAQRVENLFLSQFGLDQIKITTDRGGRKNVQVNLADVIAERIEKVRELIQTPGTGTLAFATLLWGALSLMLVIERAFNHIYRAPKARSWARRITLYWCVLTLGPLGVAVSLGLSHYVHGMVTSGALLQQWVGAPLALAAGFLVSWALLLIMYKVIPETLVRWRSALLGALVGALCFEVGKYAFGVYVRYSVGTRNWYGSLAIVPLFMFWIYLTWNFVLVGLQISYIHQYFAALTRRLHFQARYQVPIADLRWVLPIAVLLNRRFRAGMPLTYDQAAEELGLAPDVAEYMLKALERHQIVYSVEGKRGFALARPPERITAADLLDAAKSLCPAVALAHAADEADFAPGLAKFEAAEAQVARSQTLAGLAGAGPGL